MVCVYCSADTQVINSRLQKRLNQVWRRRRCLACGNAFTTHESTDLAAALAVRYSSKDVQPFSRDKLFTSLYESCKHRPQAISDADGLAQTVIGLLLRQVSDGSLDRRDIVVAAIQVLSRFDSTAAAVYKAFHAL